MPSRLPNITADDTAFRIAHRPETITLSNAQAIYVRLAEEVSRSFARSGPTAGSLMDLVLFIRGLIDTPAPDGLVTSARMLVDAADLVELAQEARIDIAALFDRFDTMTKDATEALEIITAWAALLEAADADLRCGTAAG